MSPLFVSAVEARTRENRQKKTAETLKHIYAARCDEN